VCDGQIFTYEALDGSTDGRDTNGFYGLKGARSRSSSAAAPIISPHALQDLVARSPEAGTVAGA